MILDKAINQTRVLVFITIGVFILFLCSLIVNVFLSIVAYNLRHNITTVVLPFDNSKKFELKNNNYNLDYMQEMGISFVSLRLNTTPETVHKQHELLLSYVDEESRADVSAVLADEENIIINDEITSAFYYDSINLYPENDIFEIKGVLKTWSGTRQMKDQKKTYQLKVYYKNGQFKILQFIEVKDDKDN